MNKGGTIMVWKWSVTGRPIRVEKADSCTTSTLLLLKRSKKKKPQKTTEPEGSKQTMKRKMTRRRRWKGDTGSYLKPVALLQRGHGNRGDQRLLASPAYHAVMGTAARTHARSVITRYADWMTGGALVSDTWNYCLTFGFKKQKRQSVIKKKKSYGCDLNALN